ncbi:MAG TPA: hypothetical protein VFV59_10700 [Candidatus Limnocylindria bacterium]|nr:hypothetical protein [Candidatus Limnocylindria bacterium]
MATPIVYVDRSRITTSDIAALKAATRQLAAFVEAHEPQLLHYAIFVDVQHASMSVVAVHPDSASLAVHLAIGGPEFRKVGAFIELERIDVFGQPSSDVVAKLREKADALGRNAHVHVVTDGAGFSRLGSDPGV